MTTEEAIKQISEILKNINFKSTPLMDKPENFNKNNHYKKRAKGGWIHSDNEFHHDPTYWNYPKGVEEKIDDNKWYYVWYDCRDTADIADSTSNNNVVYIEEINRDKELLKEYFDSVINEEL